MVDFEKDETGSAQRRILLKMVRGSKCDVNEESAEPKWNDGSDTPFYTHQSPMSLRVIPSDTDSDK